MLSSQRIHITHVKQTHMPLSETNMDPNDLEAIAYSQYNVCRAVISNPNALVLKESLYENYTPDLMDKNLNKEYVKKFFPNGLPENYFELSEDQKYYLAKRSGVVTLFDLGILSHIYKSIGKEESEEINMRVLKGDFEAIYKPRELLAVKYAQKIAMSLCKEDVHVLLIFGSAHNFDTCISSLSHNENVFYHGCIETEYSSKSIEMSSSDTISGVYTLSNNFQPPQRLSLSGLSIFHKQVNQFSISTIPPSSAELPLFRQSESDIKDALQELSRKFSGINFSNGHF